MAPTAHRQDGGEEELLGDRVPAAVVVQIDPDPVLGAIQPAVGVGAACGVVAATDADGPLEVAGRGEAEGQAGGPEPEDGGPAFVADRVPLDDRHVERHAPGASLARHAVLELDPTIAV